MNLLIYILITAFSLTAFSQSLAGQSTRSDVARRGILRALDAQILGKPAPEMALHDLAGHPVHISDFRGKTVLLNFWATWCSGCRAESPWLVQAQKQYHDRDFEVVGVALDDAGVKQIKAFMKELKINYPVLIGEEGAADAYIGVMGLPNSFLIDRTGIVVEHWAGVIDPRSLEQILTSVLAQSSPRQHTFHQTPQ